MKTKELEKVVKSAVEEVVSKSLKDATSVFAKIKEINTLKEEIEDLRIAKKGKEWDYEKREMEVEHKVGLERKRQEFEVEQAKREAIVSVREENLDADKKRFEEQMTFIETRFSSEVGYLKEIVGEVLTCVKDKPSKEKDDSDNG